MFLFLVQLYCSLDVFLLKNDVSDSVLNICDMEIDNLDQCQCRLLYLCGWYQSESRMTIGLEEHYTISNPDSKMDNFSELFCPLPFLIIIWSPSNNESLYELYFEAICGVMFTIC
jgi:hypothetical protein